MLRIGIAIATFNGQKYIIEQLDSICKQTIVPDEILICDDCSTDDTISLVQSFLEKQSIMFRIISHEYNTGPTDSFFDALMKLDTDIVFFADQDDVWEFNKIEEFIKVFNENKNCKLVFSDAYITNSDLDIERKSLWEKISYSAHMSIKKEMLRRNVFTGMNMAIRKELIDADEKFSSNMLHDEYLGWKALRYGEVIPLDLKLAKYRQHGSNVVGASSRRKFISFSDMREKIQYNNVKCRNKYIELNMLWKDDLFGKQIQRALDFHQSRVEMMETDSIKSKIKIYFRNIKNGGYSRYTSNTDKAKLKDLICIVCDFVRKG